MNSVGYARLQESRAFNLPIESTGTGTALNPNRADRDNLGCASQYSPRSVAKGRNRPILLKKSAMVSTVEKYAREIKIFALSRGFQAQISRSGAQKRHFQRSVCKRSGRAEFFNRIGQKRPFARGRFRPRAVIDFCQL